MAFPRRLLHDGEDLVADLRPHWSSLALPAMLLAASIGVLLALADASLPEVLQLLAGLATLVALARFVVRYLRWATTNFVVTSDRLIHRSGVVAKQGTEIPLERVSTVLFRQSMPERLLRCGELVIESGGEKGGQRFRDIPRPSAVQNDIYGQIEKHRERMHQARGAPPSAGLTLVEQLERLDHLCRRGVLSRREFEAEKAQLLGQSRR
ncbi:MAG: PH domain-containing protein [Acidimicrobiales bacterium]